VIDQAHTLPLRRSILVGIVYDWAVAILIFASAPAVLAALRLEPPPEPFHFKQGGLLLAVLPLYYMIAWRDPVRNAGIVGAMIATRVAGFVYLTLYGWSRGVAPAYLAFGLVDLAFGIVHLILARRAGFSTRDLFPIFSSR
jgi:hypothetical protein